MKTVNSNVTDAIRRGYNVVAKPRLTIDWNMSPDGKQLVDVEIEVEDIPGVIQIDVRVTKT